MFAFTQTAKCGMMMAVKEYRRQVLVPLVGLPDGYRRLFMERWENRYANGRKGNVRAVEHTRVDRIKTILLILFAVALLGVGIAGGKAIAFRSDAKELMIARAMTECSSAVSQTNTLSRSGGSDTAGALGKIRANVKAVEVLSGIHHSLYGSALAPQTAFMDIYNIIDSYSTKLKNGTSTIEELTLLGDRLTALQTTLQSSK